MNMNQPISPITPQSGGPYSYLYGEDEFPVSFPDTIGAYTARSTGT